MSRLFRSWAVAGVRGGFPWWSRAVRELDQHVGVTGIRQLAGADQVLAAQLARIETFLRRCSR